MPYVNLDILDEVTRVTTWIESNPLGPGPIWVECDVEWKARGDWVVSFHSADITPPEDVFFHAVYGSENVEPLEAFLRQVEAVESSADAWQFVAGLRATYLNTLAVGDGDWVRGSNLLEARAVRAAAEADL